VGERDSVARNATVLVLDLGLNDCMLGPKSCGCGEAIDAPTLAILAACRRRHLIRMRSIHAPWKDISVLNFDVAKNNCPDYRSIGNFAILNL
jgi:hypothetical protein